MFFLKQFFIWNVFFKTTHVLPLILAKYYDKMHFKTDATGLFLLRIYYELLSKFVSVAIVFSVLIFSQNLPMYSILPHILYLQKY